MMLKRAGRLKASLVCFFAILGLCGSFAADAIGDEVVLKPDAQTVQELHALRGDLMEALRTGDRSALERILADGFVFVHSTGTMETRKQYIDRVVASVATAGRMNLEFIDEDIRVYDGRTVVWITRSVRRDAVGSSELHFRGTDVLVRIGGHWRWASVHSTRVATPVVKLLRRRRPFDRSSAAFQHRRKHQSSGLLRRRRC
ncbi:MAG: hypothetical protein JWM87_97 [Candidatus Eremiobacteraeota bacterium]|nr:hypothetical protein [Candidatus Eremiobacteraeota bacterium]